MTSKIATPARFVAALPALLGFVPRESAVLVPLDGEGTIIFAARADMGDFGAATCKTIIEAAQQNDAASVAVCFVTDDAVAVEEFATILPVLLSQYGLSPRLIVEIETCDVPARWTEHLSGHTGISDDWRENPMTASRIAQGNPIHNDRNDQVALFDAVRSPVDPAENVDAVECIRNVIQAVNERGIMTAELAARIGGMITASVRHRDALLRVAGQDAEIAADLMRQAANLLHGKARSEVLAVAAMCYYCTGNGGPAGMALEAAKRTETGQSRLGALLDKALQAGMHYNEVRETIPTYELASELLEAPYPED